MLRAKIVKISKEDAFHEDRGTLIGLTGLWFSAGTWRSRDDGALSGYEHGNFIADHPVEIDGEPTDRFCFLGVKMEALDEDEAS